MPDEGLQQPKRESGPSSLSASLRDRVQVPNNGTILVLDADCKAVYLLASLRRRRQ
jgi:hypothetical protein